MWLPLTLARYNYVDKISTVIVARFFSTIVSGKGLLASHSIVEVFKCSLSSNKRRDRSLA